MADAKKSDVIVSARGRGDVWVVCGKCNAVLARDSHHLTGAEIEAARHSC